LHIEGHQPAAVRHCQSQKIQVGELAVSMNAAVHQAP
jgi:hypothetical protein